MGLQPAKRIVFRECHRYVIIAAAHSRSSLKLSIIIVNYNVQYFLEQCLLSVEKAIVGLDAEVFVVDNSSVDGSVEMVRNKFQWVQLIANQDNPGFSKANNQAMRIAKGEYILLLNPDTVVQEDTFLQVIGFMNSHSDAGGLGVKMVDGHGNYLPESKRGLPTPETAFYKIFGINSIFSKSKKFNRYYMGHLSNDEVHEIEILSGAFMLMRKLALEKVGFLDEAFFMYGEDIDLSWRIVQGGWKNYYYPHTSIIHYKGESTKKGSLNYVFVFYNAMVIFAQKHFSEKNAKLFSIFINVAIWLRAAVAITGRFVQRTFLPIVDGGTTFFGLWISKNIYASTQHKIYDDSMLNVGFSACVLLWILAVWLSGGYDKPLKPQRILKPLFIGLMIILVAYALLPESLRFSRALILIGAGIAGAVFFTSRVVSNLITTGKTGLKKNSIKRIAVVGEMDELIRVKNILTTSNPEVVHISPSTYLTEQKKLQLDEVVRVHNIEQVVFCARDISSADIISAMSNMDEKNVEFKIAPPESLYIIGSGSIETSGDALMMDVNSVSLQKNKRLKRLFDFCVSLLFILLFPLFFILEKNKIGFAKNLFHVLIGKKTWVGYSANNMQSSAIPRLKKGVLNPSSMVRNTSLHADNILKLNVLYAKDYKILNDIRIVLNGITELGK